MAIAKLTKEEQEKLIAHGHWEYLEIGGQWPGFNLEKTPRKLAVECTRCGVVLVELISGRKQEKRREGNSRNPRPRRDRTKRLEKGNQRRHR